MQTTRAKKISWETGKLTIQALVFDFDGLILETEEPGFIAWQELYREYGCELQFDDWVKIIGTYEWVFDPVADLERCIGRPFNDDRALKRRQQREAELIQAQPVMPGVVDYLQTAQRLGLKIGLASSSPPSWVYGHLTRLGLLDYFEVIRTRGDAPVTKPDPGLYLAACAGLGVQPGDSIALEDSPNGVTAAKRAGMYCVVVPTVMTKDQPLEHADRRLNSLAEISLEDLLREVEAQQVV